MPSGYSWPLREYRERTAGPSTTLRSGRDDNSVAGDQVFLAEALAGTTELSSRPKRSSVEGPAVPFPVVTCSLEALKGASPRTQPVEVRPT
jgi:hypothetical protein